MLLPPPLVQGLDRLVDPLRLRDRKLDHNMTLRGKLDRLRLGPPQDVPARKLLSNLLQFASTVALRFADPFGCDTADHRQNCDQLRWVVDDRRAGQGHDQDRVGGRDQGSLGALGIRVLGEVRLVQDQAGGPADLPARLPEGVPGHDHHVRPRLPVRHVRPDRARPAGPQVPGLLPGPDHRGRADDQGRVDVEPLDGGDGGDRLA